VAATEDYGLVVGINDYEHTTYPALEGAKRDAEDFIKWLKSPAGGNLPDQNIDPFTKLWNDGASEGPVLSYLWSLLKELRKLGTASKKKRIGRRLYIFLAGHGISPMELDEAGLVTIDADDGYTPHLAGKEHADSLCLSGRFEEVLLFMDCCRVTDMLLEKIGNPFSEKPDPALAGKVKRFYAFSTAFGKIARETDHNGVVRGIFSRVLLDGLNGGVQPDEKGRLTTTMLRAYLEVELRKVRLDGEEQVPKFIVTDEIVLADGLVPKCVAVHLRLLQPAHDIAVLDGGNNLVPVVPQDKIATADGLQFFVPVGKTYLIQALDATGKPTGMMTTINAEGEEVYATL
jgi:hypothetical protein